MKKAIIPALALVLILVSIVCLTQAEEGPRFVTVREWLDAKGECGECMILLKITRILNPVLAAAADETGTINLFSGSGEDSMIINFMSDECPQEGAILVIADPRYNEYEGTVEMADWKVLRIMKDPALTAGE
ncbi:MAG: hypothetical protein IJQ88_04870 [Clostridia bacterium]|nr:hypothetical protein [Clostridia bacterium]MBQ7184905.1 hypothetical protein [Clostridia bacterium]